MSEPREYRMIGGPWDGQRLSFAADEVQIEGYPRMSYHQTKVWTPPEPDPYWWANGSPEPTFEHVMEWHRRGWVSPAVRMIREALYEATAKVFG